MCGIPLVTLEKQAEYRQMPPLRALFYKALKHAHTKRREQNLVNSDQNRSSSFAQERRQPSGCISIAHALHRCKSPSLCAAPRTSFGRRSITSPSAVDDCRIINEQVLAKTLPHGTSANNKKQRLIRQPGDYAGGTAFLQCCYHKTLCAP